MAMNMDAALRITAKVDGANNITSLNRSLQTVGSTAKGVTGALVGLTGASAGLSGALGALAPLASIAGLVGLAKGSLDAGDKMFDLAQKTGVSVEALARFKKAASTTGTDIDAVSKALVKLSKGMVEAAATGKGKAADSLKALGLSATDASGKLKGADQVTLEIANRFKSMADGPVKAALALNLFGKAGADMIPMLNMGGSAIDKLSVKMTTAFAEKADAYKNKLTALSGKVGAFGADLLIALLPALNAVTDAVGGAVSAFNSLSAPIKNVAVGGALMAIAWGPLGGLFGTMGKIAVPILANAMTYLAYQTALAGGSLSALSAGLAMVKGAMLAIPGWGWALAGAAALAALLTWVYETNEGFRDLVDSVANVVATDFKAAMNQMGKLASDTGKWIGETWTFLVNDARLTAGEISKAFSSNFGFIAEMADWLSKNVGGKINEMVNAIPKSIRDKLGIGLQSAATGAINALPGGAVSLYALSVMQRAGGAKPAGKEAPKEQPKPEPPPFEPDITALGGEDKDNREALARAREGLLLDLVAAGLQTEYGLAQRQINDLTLRQNAANDAGNVILSLQIDKSKAILETGLETKKIFDEENRKLSESASNQDKFNSKLREALIIRQTDGKVLQLTEQLRVRTLEIDQKITAEKKRQADLQKQLLRGQADALREISDRSRYGAITDLQGSEKSRRQQEEDGLRRRIADARSDGGDGKEEEAKRLEEQLQRLQAEYKKLDEQANSAAYGVAKGIRGYLEGIGSLADSVANATKNVIQNLEDGLSTFFETGKFNFKDFASYAIKQLQRVVLQQLIMKPLMNVLGGLFSGGGGGVNTLFNPPMAAKGMVLASNGIQPFAMGGIVNRPTLFPFAKGIGLMGEAGPEAIMPLRRGADGKLGVAGGGGGSTTINVSVDAKGTSVQGDGSQGAALGRAIAGAVQAELIKARRPGGILSN